MRQNQPSFSLIFTHLVFHLSYSSQALMGFSPLHALTYKIKVYVDAKEYRIRTLGLKY